MRDLFRRLVREPLIHFALLSAVLFVGRGAWPGAEGAVGDGAIRVSASFVSSLAERHRERTGVAPTEQELEGLVQRHVREEALVREGQALGFHLGDPIVRRRIIQRMSFLLDAQADVAEPTDAELRRWLEAHADTYRVPARFGGRHLFCGEGADGRNRCAEALAASEPRAREAVARPLPVTPDFGPTTVAALGSRFGGELASRVAEAEPGQWEGPVRSRFGWHLVRVDTHLPARLPSLEEVRPRVVSEVRRARREAHREEAIEALVDAQGVEVTWPEDRVAARGEERGTRLTSIRPEVR